MSLALHVSSLKLILVLLMYLFCPPLQSDSQDAHASRGMSEMVYRVLESHFTFEKLSLEPLNSSTIFSFIFLLFYWYWVWFGPFNILKPLVTCFILSLLLILTKWKSFCSVAKPYPIHSYYVYIFGLSNASCISPFLFYALFVILCCSCQFLYFTIFALLPCLNSCVFVCVLDSVSTTASTVAVFIL